MNEPGLANHTSNDSRFRFLTQRVIAQVVGHAANAAALLSQLDEHFRFAGIHRQRLFAKHVLAGAKQRAGLLEMEVVRGADVHHVDGGIRRQFRE